MTKLGYEKAFVKMDPRFSWPYFFTRFSDKSQKVLFLSSQAWYRPLLRRYIVFRRPVTAYLQKFP